MHSLGLVGGTFDRFHSGHRALIERGLAECVRLELWLTSDHIANSKDSRIEPWADRSTKILTSLGDSADRVSLHVLEDADGPAPWHETANAILCTPETLSGCERINQARAANSLGALEVIVVEHVTAHDGAPISSSRVRAGEIDLDGEPYLPADAGQVSMIMTHEVEANLKDPFGQLFEGPEDDPSVAMRAVLEEIFGSPGPVIAVGDVTVKTLQDLGSPADIALIDGKTKREEWEHASTIDHSLYNDTRTCENPAGQLSAGLYLACAAAIQAWCEDGRSCLINVDGEEDLAPLLLHPLAPLGAVVLYGQPGRGVVLRWTGADSKSRCRDLLTAMVRD
ncbi:TPA: DUF359 domain-containing protein [Candidatus Thalassarchaeaceae archaeon]|jgi:pantetheine-phosphate adenylyltransferase|nr:hypothetical protein [Euryarchaeota archaeon]DAC67222.1 MAG TPA: DUF359 domain-containing protein [Candidatus Poseidoniales archaeon]HII43288.1 DUF359 domain-containing protein [Candidatus Thalassarchaeaceae archaeon]|tara:strand:+ start:15190 stop:16203 length:1014 start_codon:yes stop_codon:yes gene_type:complete